MGQVLTKADLRHGEILGGNHKVIERFRAKTESSKDRYISLYNQDVICIMQLSSSAIFTYLFILSVSGLKQTIKLKPLQV
jgi:hypothetical protein